MADAVVSYAVQKLDVILRQQAGFFLGIKDDVEWLRKELGMMQSYLKVAEQKQGSDERIHNWISELQDIAYDSEDTFKIFLFIFRVNKEPIHSSTCERMSSSVRNCFCSICKNVKLYGIGKHIKKLKERVREIDGWRRTYEINATDITSIGDLTTTSAYGDDLVGLEDDFDKLHAKLCDGPQTRVISILGMGGLGKTTLARKLYHGSEEFSQRGWVYVSQDWTTNDLYKQLIKSFRELTNEERTIVDTMGPFELERRLRIILEEHKYLVVIDDVWQRRAWESIKNALPDNNKGSRIIITTRNEDVAPPSGDVTPVHKLRFLRDEESWSLFRKKAFPGNNGECPNNHFEKLGKEMTAKCGGLPLAIVVLGRLLSRKQINEWETVKNNIWQEVKDYSINDISPISPILDLSYNDLSINIKSCFLYLGIYPEDASIDVEELVKLWVAEGFIPMNGEGPTPEEVSKGYFKELLRRNLVQTVEENWRMTSSCRVHGLLRYLALTKERETNFIRVCDERVSSTSLSSTSCRRFAVYSGEQREELLKRSHKKVRTLSFLNDKSSIHYKTNKKINVSIVWSFTLLRVLKIEGVDLSGGETKSTSFEIVGEMIHLGYFGLKDTFIRELPDSIRNLKALQTLSIEPLDSSVTLPKDICKLKELRHLEGHFSVDLSNLAELTNLQTLKVMIQNKATIGENCNFLATLKNLRTSKMQQSPVSDTIPIEPLFNCKQLIELKIMGGGTIREVPKGIHEHLTELKYLELFLSGSEDDPIPELEKLPSLLALHLSYDENKTIRWTFTANGFPHLKFLKLGNASNMVLSVAEDAMPELQFLCLENGVKQTLSSERLRSLPGEGP